MPSRLRLSWAMKTLKLFLLPVLDSLEFGWRVIRYALIFVSAFFRQRASLGCEMVAIRGEPRFAPPPMRAHGPESQKFATSARHTSIELMRNRRGTGHSEN